MIPKQAKDKLLGSNASPLLLEELKLFLFQVFLIFLWKWISCNLLFLLFLVVCTSKGFMKAFKALKKPL